VNIAGCLILGYVTTRLQERLPLSLYRRPLLGTGFCGALTTFSTFQIELLKMIDHHRWETAAGYRRQHRRRAGRHAAGHRPHPTRSNRPVTAWAWLAVAGLGGVGAILRFLIDGIVSARASARLPVGTLAVNLSGSFALGAITGAALTGTALTLAGTATIGSYTTFSTWMLETHRLSEDGNHTIGSLNLLASLALGLGAAALGRYLARHL
jgi:CrcB protein